MSYAFDGANRLCILGAGTTVLHVADMYSRWKEWVATDDNMKYLPFMEVVGGNPTVGANAISSYFFVLNGWRIRPYEGHHSLTVDGILNGAEGAEVFADTVGNWRVRIVQIVPLQAETITVSADGSGGTGGASASEVANAVWSHPKSGLLLTWEKFVGLFAALR